MLGAPWCSRNSLCPGIASVIGIASVPGIASVIGIASVAGMASVPVANLQCVYNVVEKFRNKRRVNAA